MKKTICILLLIVTMCAAFAPGAAAAQRTDDASVRRWTHIVSITNDLIISGGVAKMKVSVYCDTRIIRIEITARLQKQNGSSWSPVAT